MTDTLSVEIPADVKDNNTRVVRITSRDERDTEGSWPAARHLADYRKRTRFYGYTLHEWDDVSRDGHRITLSWFANTLGHHVWLYETSYYTRVTCQACLQYRAQSYAAHYVTVTGGPLATDEPVPLCGKHRSYLLNQLSTGPGTPPSGEIHLSEPLRIGQH